MLNRKTLNKSLENSKFTLAQINTKTQFNKGFYQGGTHLINAIELIKSEQNLFRSKTSRNTINKIQSELDKQILYVKEKDNNSDTEKGFASGVISTIAEIEFTSSNF